MSGAPPLFAEALARHQAGDFIAAETAYRRLLTEHPDHSRLLFLLGTLLHQTGRQGEAASHLRRSLRAEPGNVQALNSLGAALSELGETEEAEAALRQALTLDPGHAKAAYNLGNLLLRAGRKAEAETAFRRSIAADTEAIEPRNNLAALLQSLGRAGEAAGLLRECVGLAPENPDLHYNLGVALFEDEQYREAAEAYGRAAGLAPDRAEFHNNLGIALARLDRTDQALDAYRRALELAPGFAKAWNNLGMLQQEGGELAKAEAAYRRAVELAPDHAEAHWNLGLCRLLQGDFAEGFREYEWRWRIKGRQLFAPPGGQPFWRGEELNGRILLLHGEQGLGDSIQFCRYARLLAEKGEKVVLAVQPPLARLISTLHPAITVVPGGQALPPFDCHSPLLSLPHLLGTRPETIPADIPYLAADPACTAHFEALLPPRGGRRRIGLVWAGSRTHRGDRFRSLDFARLGPLLELDAHFVSLQLGEAAGQAEGLIDLTGELTDFADTAGLIACLDLVIGVDTAAVHLAGALGIPTLVLLPFAPDWRWLTDRPDTPWYPSLRLFRQKIPGGWNEVIASLREHCSRQ